ncbi:hypothetical protein PO909_029764 [Leuciscus waleckii]
MLLYILHFIGVREAWEGKNVYVLLSKLGPFKIFFEDIRKTAPSLQIESEVMNAYMYYLVQKFNRETTERAAAIDSFEMTRIWEGETAKVKMDLMLYQYIFGIINDCHHWTLLIMIPKEQRVLYLDPLGERQHDLKRCQEVTR